MDGRLWARNVFPHQIFKAASIPVYYLRKVLHQTGGTIELHI